MLIMLVLTFCFLPQERAAAQNVEAGILSSPRYAGISARIPMRSGIGTELRCYADIMDSIDGSHSPGVMADWHLLFPVLKKTSDGGTTVTLNAGVGVATGRVRDFHEKTGIAGGLSALFAAELNFRRPITVSIGISGILGCHITSDNKFTSTMTLYRNGLVRAFIPEVTISYRFR